MKQNAKAGDVSNIWQLTQTMAYQVGGGGLDAVRFDEMKKRRRNIPLLTLVRGGDVAITVTEWRINGTPFLIRRIHRGGGSKSWHEPIQSIWTVENLNIGWVILSNDSIRLRRIHKHQVSIAKYVLDHPEIHNPSVS